MSVHRLGDLKLQPFDPAKPFGLRPASSGIATINCFLCLDGDVEYVPKVHDLFFPPRGVDRVEWMVDGVERWRLAETIEMGYDLRDCQVERLTGPFHIVRYKAIDKAYLACDSCTWHGKMRAWSQRSHMVSTDVLREHPICPNRGASVPS